MTEIKELPAIKDTTEDFEELERVVLRLFKTEIYLPLIKKLNIGRTLQNAKWDDSGKALLEALRTGRVTFYRGVFSGKWNASISKDLHALKAKYKKKTNTFHINTADLPMDVRNAASAGEQRFLEKIAGINKALGEMVPAKIADKLRVEKIFDRTIWRTNQSFKQTVKGVTVAPDLSDADRARIADEWNNNLQLSIKKFSEEQILKLRKSVEKSVFTGNRYEDMYAKIKKSYGVSENKAKFLARQETNLLMAKFKETRYQAAGVNLFKWQCVAGSKNHPVRPTHKVCEGKYFLWDNPREVDINGVVKPNGVHKPGENDNPGEDYNCRCSARPIVRFKK